MSNVLRSLNHDTHIFLWTQSFVIIDTTRGLYNNTTFSIGLTAGIIDNHLFVKLMSPLFYHNLLFPFLYVSETFFSPHFVGVWFTTFFLFSPDFLPLGIVPANKLLGSAINSFFLLLHIAIMRGLGVWKDASYKWRPCSWSIFSMYA